MDGDGLEKDQHEQQLFLLGWRYTQKQDIHILYKYILIYTNICIMYSVYIELEYHIVKDHKHNKRNNDF